MQKRDKLPDRDFIFGRKPVIDALRGGIPLEKILVAKGVQGAFDKEIRTAAEQAKVPIQLVPKERIKNLVKKGDNDQGIVAFKSPVQYFKTEDIVMQLMDQGKNPLLVILDQVTDVRNLGAIARSAECAGADAIIIPDKGGALATPMAVKTSAGALLNIPVCREKSLQNTVEFLQNSGIQIACSMLQTDNYIQEVDFTGPVAIIMGSEENGVRPHLRRASSLRFKIPQAGETQSFNVSVSTGIILYEVMRQRGNAAI